MKAYTCAVFFGLFILGGAWLHAFPTFSSLPVQTPLAWTGEGAGVGWSPTNLAVFFNTNDGAVYGIQAGGGWEKILPPIRPTFSGPAVDLSRYGRRAPAQHQFLLDANETTIDATAGKYTNLKPGDVVAIPAGTRGRLVFRHLAGTADNPIVIKNTGGVARLTDGTTNASGIELFHCRHVQVTGTGSADAFGIQIEGFDIGIVTYGQTTAFEIDHVEIRRTGFCGLMTKTDPTFGMAVTTNLLRTNGGIPGSVAKSVVSNLMANAYLDATNTLTLKFLTDPAGISSLLSASWPTETPGILSVLTQAVLAGSFSAFSNGAGRTDFPGAFVQSNTILHHNWIHDTLGGEGFYLGYSAYLTGKRGLTPHLFSGVRVYSNLVERTALDGIQVSCAWDDARVFDNRVCLDSRNLENTQMSGILIGGGSRVDVFGNVVREGNGPGIAFHGNRGRIFQNAVLFAGHSNWAARSFQSTNPTPVNVDANGIYVAVKDGISGGAVDIVGNLIVNPAKHGVEFAANPELSGCRFESNLILVSPQVLVKEPWLVGTAWLHLYDKDCPNRLSFTQSENLLGVFNTNAIPQFTLTLLTLNQSNRTVTQGTVDGPGAGGSTQRRLRTNDFAGLTVFDGLAAGSPFTFTNRTPTIWGGVPVVMQITMPWSNATVTWSVGGPTPAVVMTNPAPPASPSATNRTLGTAWDSLAVVWGPGRSFSFRAPDQVSLDTEMSLQILPLGGGRRAELWRGRMPADRGAVAVTFGTDIGIMGPCILELRTTGKGGSRALCRRLVFMAP